MSNKKQSSIEWLGLELNIIFHDITPELWEQVEVKFQQAKAMHKEEIIDATIILWDESTGNAIYGLEYYNKTYGEEYDNI
jgi:hypothetical protein